MPFFSRVPSRLRVAWLSAKLCFKTSIIRACVYYRQHVWKKWKAHRQSAAVSNARGDIWKETKKKRSDYNIWRRFHGKICDRIPTDFPGGAARPARQRRYRYSYYYCYILLYRGMVVTGCRRQVALLSPSSLPPPPRRSARDFRYNFYFFLHFFLSSSDCSTAVSLRWSSVPCCMWTLSVARRPVLVSYVHFVFFSDRFFLLVCVFFHCYCSLCAEGTRVEGRRTRTIFSHVVHWWVFFFTNIHTLIFFLCRDKNAVYGSVRLDGNDLNDDFCVTIIPPPPTLSLSPFFSWFCRRPFCQNFFFCRLFEETNCWKVLKFNRQNNKILDLRIPLYSFRFTSTLLHNLLFIYLYTE